jgi:hypothetical protein
VRATTPSVSMASAGWDDPTTNQKVTILLECIWKRWQEGYDDRGGRCRVFLAIGFWGKNKYNKIRRGFRRPQIDDCTQQPTKNNAGAMGGGYVRTRDRRVTQEGLYSIVLGAVEMRGGRE